MEITTYSQCACANCGHVIEFLPTRAGEIVECPKCGEKSRLPEVEKLGIIEVQGPAIPDSKTCPVCGKEIRFYAGKCVYCEERRQRKVRCIIGAATGVFVLLLAGVIVFWPRPRETVPVVTYEQPTPRLPKSINDLRPSHFGLEQKHGSDLVLAVGDIVNDSENHHSNLRADADLLDKAGTTIGTVSDICTELGPHQTWHFVATVTKTNAMSVHFSVITEK
jgi:hypothetical protein